MSTPNFQPRWTCKYRKPNNPIEAQNLYNHIRTVAYLLDASSEWLIPAFPALASLPPELHFGLESVIGAVLPAVGDVLGVFLGLYQVFLSMLFGLPPNVIGLMIFYLVADAFIGIIPIIGEFLDVAFKANLYNLRLLEKELKRSPKWAQAVGILFYMRFVGDDLWQVIIPQYTDWTPRRKKGTFDPKKSWWDTFKS